MVILGVADRAPERIPALDAFVPRDGEATVDLMSPQAARLMAAASRSR
jgi:hypothetical protein